MQAGILPLALLGIVIAWPAVAYDRGTKQTMSISIEGVERRWQMFIPSLYEEGAKFPLVLNFHGTGANSDLQTRLSDIEALADKERFLVAGPEAIYPAGRAGWFTWNVDQSEGGVDDVRHRRRFESLLPEQLRERVEHLVGVELARPTTSRGVCISGARSVDGGSHTSNVPRFCDIWNPWSKIP